ncbi:hypothetical protein [Planomicrobium sp. CPCC 101110]|uniref:hypothetical protein n=1 Tax=Planomicrobium sp. CPCC 101110 TaxID=2599619 RepID=UPI0011B7620D|nr:hypothetical protein [Planomicrobium sp. CPCC 101110]TWT27566.1 hypothetical protein FQV30_03370 [Planomicrobium sp. CPCC 101110]
MEFFQLAAIMPAAYMKFRDGSGNSSAFQFHQCRMIGIVLGYKTKYILKLMKKGNASSKAGRSYPNPRIVRCHSEIVASIT